MSKHTPAPWTVNPKAKTNIRHGSLTIANCSSTHDGSRGEEEIANAKLIAAAPELLEALEAMKDYCKYHKISLGSGIVQKVDEAIKKATL